MDEINGILTLDDITPDMVNISNGSGWCGCFVISKRLASIRSIMRTDISDTLLKNGLHVRWKCEVLTFDVAGDHKASFTKQSFEKQLKEIRQ